MKIPKCQVFSVGEISTWGKQFLSALETANILDVIYESSVSSFCNHPTPPIKPSIVFIENLPESRQWISRIRSSGRRAYLVWFGRTFSKDDLLFAVEQRVYMPFEQARADETRVREGLSKVLAAQGRTEQFDQMLHSLKSLLIQAEADSNIEAVLAELRTAVSKLEQLGLSNEFVGLTGEAAYTKDQKLPFYRAQGFGDALLTVHNLERTGVLWVKGSVPEQEGRVEFLQGKVVSCAAGAVRGTKAIYRMFLWDEPRFLFTRRDPQTATLGEPIEHGMKYICAEGETFRRRFEKIRHELPPADLQVELDPKAIHQGTQLSRDDFQALASVVEFGQVDRILDFNPLADVNLYESLIRLKKNQVIRVAS